jgi:2-methylcitrate dehydratase PrpD
MSEDPDRTRRWLINASGAVILSNALAPGRSYAQVANSPTAKTLDPDGPAADAPISPVTIALSDYVANTLDRDLPPDVVAKTKLHTLDTIAAMMSGSRLKAGEMAAHYVDSLGGNPQATVVGTSILTSTVNAALANGMAAHSDETDDSHLRGRFHPGCGIVPAALATAELADRSEHVEKAFDFGGMGARDGVTAATMIASGFTGVDDFLSGTKNLFTTIGGERPLPSELTAELGNRFEIMNTSIKKWTVGSPLQSVLDGVAVLLKDPAVRADKVKRVVVDMPADRLHIVDNRSIPDICLQHLVAMMIVDGGVTFNSIHDVARMRDPKVLAVRKLVDAVPNQELVSAVPARQSIVKIETTDGRMLSHRTYEVRGTPGNPMDADEVAAKALDLMVPILGIVRANELIATVYKLDSFGPVSGLRRLLQA